jgi:hypothetical protein
MPKERIVKAFDCHCLKCDYKWTTTRERIPICCPKCRNKDWDKPRRRKSINTIDIEKINVQPTNKFKLNKLGDTNGS